MSTDIHLRELMSSDLDPFFEFQLDSEASHMAAFVVDNPTDRAAFDAHWRRIQEDSSVVVRSIEYDGRVVGSVCSYSEANKEEVTYWLSKAYWGRGIATKARSLFLKQIIELRPIYARVAFDNLGSRKVLERSGFRVVGNNKDYAAARGIEIDELFLELNE